VRSSFQDGTGGESCEDNRCAANIHYPLNYYRQNKAVIPHCQTKTTFKPHIFFPFSLGSNVCLRGNRSPEGPYRLASGRAQGMLVSSSMDRMRRPHFATPSRVNLSTQSDSRRWLLRYRYGAVQELADRFVQAPAPTVPLGGVQHYEFRLLRCAVRERIFWYLECTFGNYTGVLTNPHVVQFTLRYQF